MDQLGITIFDIFVFAIALFGAAMGMSAGFTHALLFIVAWNGAAWIAWRFSGLIKPEIAKLAGGPELAEYASLLVVFVGALIVLVMLTHALSRSVRGSPLNKPDRFLGAGFGALCAWFTMGLVLLLYSYLSPRQLPAAVEGGATFPMIRQMANFIEPYIPSSVRIRLQRPGQNNPAPPIPPQIKLPQQ